MNIQQEQFLNDTLILAGFNPEVDDFELLKEDMRPILDEFIELNLYKFLDDQEKSEYDRLEDKSLDFFEDRISNFDNILAELYIIWQKQYLGYMMEDEESQDEETYSIGKDVSNENIAA